MPKLVLREDPLKLLLRVCYLLVQVDIDHVEDGLELDALIGGAGDHAGLWPYQWMRIKLTVWVPPMSHTPMRSPASLETSS